MVEERLGRSVFGAEPPLRIEGVLKASSEPPRWRAKLVLVDASGNVLGTRDVTSRGEDCRSIDASLALVVAVMIDPLAALRAPRAPQEGLEKPPEPERRPPEQKSVEAVEEPPAKAEEPPARSEEPVPSPAPVSDAGPPHEVRQWSRWSSVATFGVTAGLGPAPALSWGLTLSVQAGTSESTYVLFRFPVYPYALVEGAGGATGRLSGFGLGFELGFRRGKDLKTWRLLASAGVEASGFASSSGPPPERLELLGRIDALARLGVQRKLSSQAALVLECHVGWAPLSPSMRLVMADGRPDDRRLSPVRFGIDVALGLPMG